MSDGWKIALVISAIVGLAATAIISFEKLEKVEPGYVGVSVKKCGDAKVSQDPIPTGYYWRELFCEDVVKYPISMQSLILTKNPHEGTGGTSGKEEDQSIMITSSEGLNIETDIALNFTLDPKKVPLIYERWRSDLEDISHKYIRQSVREAMQLTFAKYRAEELYSNKKEISRMEVEALLVAKLSPFGFVISQFTINRIAPPTQVIQAINAKVAMIQLAQQSEQEVKKKQAEASQQVAVAQGKADSMRTEAQGEAQAISLRADAQAKANKILAESVTPALIEYEKAMRWNGVLPTVTGGVTPMLQLK